MIRVDWVIKDDEGKSHIIQLEGDKKNEYFLYVDGKHLEKIKMSKFFNSEYTFEVFGTKCSLVKLMFNETPKLVVNNEFKDDPKRFYSPIPKPSVVTYITIVINLLLCMSSLIYLVANFNNDNGMRAIYIFGLSLIAVVAIAYVSTAPLICTNAKIRFVIRMLLTLMTTAGYAFIIYRFLQ